MSTLTQDTSCWTSDVPCQSCGEKCATNGADLWCVNHSCKDYFYAKPEKKKNIFFSSKTDNHATPDHFFKRMNDEFNFTLDVCADAQNAKCLRYFTKEMDGLAQSWAGEICWMNPPYGEPEHVCKKNCKKKRCIERGYCNPKYVPGIADWLKKAYDSSKQGAVVVCLIPANTDTAWWHDLCMQGEIRFVRGRLTFNGVKDPAPFASAVVIFRSGVVPNPRSIPNK